MTLTKTEKLRVARAAIVDDPTQGGPGFGRAMAELVDDALGVAATAAALPGRVALLALGSYARRELCPGSDIDVMLLHESRSAPQAGALWYPLWDAGLVLGHSVRTRREAISLADADLDALTSLLEPRLVFGDAELAADLDKHARRLAHRRRNRLISQLANAAVARRARPGLVGEMLEPNLKRGAGGLRDIQALEWGGRALDGAGGRSGLDTLVALGYLQPDDQVRLEDAKVRVLTARVALQRSTGTRTDVLALQDQDAVAALVGAADADVFMREVASAARDVAWIAADVWSRLRDPGPSGRVARRDRELGEGVVMRDGRVTLTAAAGPVDAALSLRVAAAAARHDALIDRGTLARLGQLDAVHWDPGARASFIEVLTAGPSAVPVLEALDHVGVAARLVPAWEQVRAWPQRNAYHRYTVDRHLLEAVAETAELRSEPGRDGDVARRAPADVLLLGALLHDIGKAGPGDHSAEGAKTARAFADRIGMEPEQAALVEWLVAHHLLLADTATRRDLSEEATIDRFGRAVGSEPRLDLLYALTIADSRATGPSAWSPAKAALCRELHARTESWLRRGAAGSEDAARHRDELHTRLGVGEADEFLDAMPPAYTTAFDAAVQEHHHALIRAGTLAVEWAEKSDELLQVTVVAPDRTGLLAIVAGVLALFGYDIHDANGYSHPDGMAIEMFTGVDRFGRLVDDGSRAPFLEMLESALDGRLPLVDELAARRRQYPAAATAGGVEVRIDLGASDVATVVEVHAPDEMGLLARVAGAFADADLDVYLAKVATLGDRVVDVFYVRDADGRKVVDAHALGALRSAIIAQLDRR